MMTTKTRTSAFRGVHPSVTGRSVTTVRKVATITFTCEPGESSLRNDRCKCFGLLESNILNSFQLQNFRRKNGSEYDSANSSGQTSYSSTASSMIEDIADKIEEIGKLDTNIHSLMYKSVEVHKDIVSLEATTNRLIADTRKLCHLRRGGRLGTNRTSEEKS
uniref:(northern house mosquito) hypothetical protein n=1 Tax=Culex pipiens TaxID=7175 RepID=A0A8D8NDB4_CULPI